MGRLAFPTVGPPAALRDPPPFTFFASRAGPTRGFARGLDVMALLGAPRARPILDELGDAAYEKYDEAFAEAAKIFPAADDAAWRRNLYWAWLDVLREYVAPRSRPTQAFELSPAWSDKTLTAALASWAQLRHDTILYVKQPFVPLGAGAPPAPPPPKGFVEPHPEVFARLAALNTMTKEGLTALGMLPVDAGAVLDEFGTLLGQLRDLAIKELEDRPITEEDNRFFVWFGNNCRRLLDRIAALIPAPGADAAASQWERPETATDTATTLVADVMTNGEAEQVLEEGTGDLELLVVAMRAPGTTGLVLAAGPVLTYYEFRWPMADRLTDEKWRQLLRDGQAPPPPPWTCSYRVPCEPAPR